MVPTDKNGISQFETGLGDLLIWPGKEIPSTLIKFL